MRDEELYLFSHYDHMGGEKIKQEKRFIFSTLKSDLFELLNNFLEEMDRKVLNFHKNLCLVSCTPSSSIFCLSKLTFMLQVLCWGIATVITNVHRWCPLWQTFLYILHMLSVNPENNQGSDIITLAVVFVRKAVRSTWKDFRCPFLIKTDKTK